MARWLKLALLLFAALAILAAVAGFVAYRAIQHVPEFYRVAIAADPAAQKTASDRMLQRTAALASDLRKEGRWQTVFTADEINGWLAVDLARNHPGLLPPAIRDPRVAITPEHVLVACRYRAGGIDTVLWLTMDAYLIEPNVIGLRIRKARAGALPLPLDEVLGQIGRASGQWEWRVDWRQADGDPVAQVRIPPPRHPEDPRVRIETLRLGEGEIYVAGSTQRR